MFRFEIYENLYALICVPIVIVLFVLFMYFRKNALKEFSHIEALKKLVDDLGKYKHQLKFVLYLFALTSLCFAFANPQWGSKREKVKRKSVDVFIALDISTSMLAEDVRPSRLDRARKFAQDLAEGLKGERIGLILFAGNAYLQMPLTTDYAAASLFLRSANPDMAPTQGTDFFEVIDLAERSFEQDNKQHKALVILTDGENHEEAALTRAAEATENGLLIFTVGVGTDGGEKIPIVYPNGQKDFKRDKSGGYVITKMNPEMLTQLANEGNGAYFNLQENSGTVLAELRKRIDKIEKRDFEQRSFTEYESYFQYFIALALLLLIIDNFINYRRNNFTKDKDLFKV